MIHERDTKVASNLHRHIPVSNRGSCDRPSCGRLTAARQYDMMGVRRSSMRTYRVGMAVGSVKKGRDLHPILQQWQRDFYVYEEGEGPKDNDGEITLLNVRGGVSLGKALAEHLPAVAMIGLARFIMEGDPWIEEN